MITIGCDPATENSDMVFKHTENGVEVLQVNGKSFKEFTDNLLDAVTKKMGVKNEVAASKYEGSYSLARNEIIAFEKEKAYLFSQTVLPYWTKKFWNMFENEQNSLTGLA